MKYKLLMFSSFLFLTITSCSILNLNPKMEYVENKFQVERFPEFKGGQKALQRYLKKNLQYPEIDKANNIKGIVRVALTIKKNGQIVDIEIINGISDSINKEAIRLIAGMPDWLPAIKNGKPVDVRIILPLNFNLI